MSVYEHYIVSDVKITDIYKFRYIFIEIYDVHVNGH